ncbi:MAG: DedA family protein [Candidatus Saccharibacteria bacterium]|nr:DedA family protein [Candidatus Saccharibacteria bacterium]
MVDFIINHGLPLLFLVVMIESFGVPLPGETALIAFAILASQGHYPIVLVIFLAALAAIIGDNLGYWLIGRWGGRKLFRKWGWLERYAERVLPQAEKLVANHGGKTVFFGRFITVLRYTAAWVAGLGKMPWGKFLFWNAAGGIVWATLVGLVAYYSGQAAANAIKRYGIYAALMIVAVVVLGGLLVHYGKKRMEKDL